MADVLQPADEPNTTCNNLLMEYEAETVKHGNMSRFRKLFRFSDVNQKKNFSITMAVYFNIVLLVSVCY